MNKTKTGLFGKNVSLCIDNKTIKNGNFIVNILRYLTKNFLVLCVFLKRLRLPSAIVVFVVGVLVAVLIHYTLHRFILSSEPFIYVVF